MAGKANVDDSVIERRLRPLYDWLDNGHYKKAIQEADKVLRKQPNLQCAAVLKALALLRLGRNEECSELIDATVSKGTSDDATLQALTICYREMHQPELICSIYEKAIKLEPANEDLISHLFMSYVRVGDYKKQQQTAMQLYKLKPKNPYYFWAVMSIVMQSRVATESVARKVSLQLAERMISKFINEDKIESEAEVLTYLYILEIQEKYSEALAIIEGPLARRITQQQQNFIPLKKANYHTHLQQYEAASIIYMNLILHEQDNWQHYVNFTDIILSMWDNHVNSHEDKADPLLEASKFLKETRENALANLGFSRSPLLGLLQLALKLKQKGLQDKIKLLCGDVTDQLRVYVKHYGDKMCCFGDIVNFLPLVPKEDVDQLLESIKEFVQMDDQNVPIDIRNIYRHQIWFQMRRALKQDDSLSSEGQLDLGDDLVSFYERTASFSSEMASTDIRPNDTYLILAAHCYFAVLPHLVLKVGSCEGEEKRRATVAVTSLLLKLCSLLEYGTNISKANFQLKLLLIKAYNLIGATSSSYAVYEKLDTKQIQMDTLGHVLALQTVDTGNYTAASDIFYATLKFFMANYKDTSDPLIMSYKFGSLIRIPEFVDFRERLNNSMHFAIVTAEQMSLELTMKVNSKSEFEEVIKQLDIDPVKEKTRWDDLKDNRDLLVMNTWEPEERRLSPSIKEETFLDEISLPKLRNTILRIVSASFNLRKNPQKSNLYSNKEKGAMVNGESNGTCDNTSIAILKDLVASLRSQAELCDKYRKLKPPQFPLQGPDPPRIYLYSKGHYIQAMVKQAEMLLRVYEATEGFEYNIGMDSWSGDVIKSLSESVDQMLSFHLPQLEILQLAPSASLPGINAQALSHLSHFVQTFSFMVILIDCCSCLLAPIKTNIAKKNKKKKGNVALPEIISHFNNYVTTLSTKVQKLDSIVKEKINRSKNQPHSTKNGCEEPSFNQILPNLDYKTVSENVQNSLVKSLSCLKELLKQKLQYLNSLRV